MSPMRNELAQYAFGVGKWIGAAPPKVDEHTLSHSPQYCVPPMPSREASPTIAVMSPAWIIWQ